MTCTDKFSKEPCESEPDAQNDSRDEEIEPDFTKDENGRVMRRLATGEYIDSAASIVQRSLYLTAVQCNESALIARIIAKHVFEDRILPVVEPFPVRYGICGDNEENVTFETLCYFYMSRIDTHILTTANVFRDVGIFFSAWPPSSEENCQDAETRTLTQPAETFLSRYVQTYVLLVSCAADIGEISKTLGLQPAIDIEREQNDIDESIPNILPAMASNSLKMIELSEKVLIDTCQLAYDCSLGVSGSFVIDEYEQAFVDEMCDKYVRGMKKAYRIEKAEE